MLPARKFLGFSSKKIGEGFHHPCVKIILPFPTTCRPADDVFGEQLKRFVEYCFEPGTAANEKLKAVLVNMLSGDQPKKKKGEGK